MIIIISLNRLPAIRTSVFRAVVQNSCKQIKNTTNKVKINKVKSLILGEEVDFFWTQNLKHYFPPQIFNFFY